MIKHKDWDINEHATGRRKSGKPIIGVTLQNGLNDIEPDRSFVSCDIGVSEVTQGVTHLKMNRGRMGELRFGDSSHPNSFLVKIKNKGLKGVSFKYMGATGSSMTANDGKPLCNFDNGISIESTPYYNGVKMDIIVNDPLTAPLEYPFSVKTYGQDYTFIEENGGATLRGEDQDPIFIKPPYAIDANGDIGPVTIHYTGIVNNLITFKKVVDEVWFRSAAAPVRIDPDVTIEDGVDGGEIEDSYIRGAFPNNNFGTHGLLDIGLTGDIRSLARVNLAKYANVTPTSAKFTLDVAGSGGSLTNVFWYRVLRDWVENQVTWNLYSSGNSWDAAGCDNTTTDREGAAQNASALTIPVSGLVDFVCKPESVELDLGNWFSIIILDPTSAGVDQLVSTERLGINPVFYMEFIAAHGWPFFFDGGHY